MNSSKELMVGEKPLSSLRVVDLKEELEKRGLSKSGSKKDLADRLKNFLLAEKQKEIPVPAADEEQLPNISMQEKLAEQNPFIRDYFASQAELFHSQKVAKKLLEEEARRESETSAPSADEESSAAEDRSPRKEVEEVPKGKVKRLARRFESRGGRAEEVTTPVEMTVDKPAVEEMPEINLGTPVEIASLDSSAEQKKEEEPVVEAVPVVEQEQVCVIAEKSTDKTNAEKVTEETSKTIEASDLTVSASKDEVADIDDSKIEANEKGNESSSVSSNSPVPASESPEPEVKSPALSPSKPAQEKATGRGISEAEHDKETEKPKDKTSSAEDVIDSKLNKNGNVKKLTEKFENAVAQEPEVVVPQKPIEKQSSVPQTRQENDADADSESSESSGSRSRSRSPKSQRAESPTQKASVSPAKHEPSPEPENKIIKLTRFDRKSESRDEELEISMDVDDQIEIGPIRNGETEKAKTASPSKPQSAVQTKSRREEEIRPNQRKLPEVVDDEEVLDYGEEDKLKMEPARFTWTRRILRLKNKYPPKEHDEKRWKIPEDMTSPIINTEYLMQWFPEVKLVPASEFKLEDKEKSPPPTSVPDKEVENVEVTRKVSIDPEDPSQAPMENITITRKVSLIPMVPSVSQPQEDMDKDLSPPRHPPSELILITNLTRPFTLPQLKELLQRTGNLLDVWVDKIKSRCIAKYEKQEEAFETRAALHGVNWPQSNPKALSVDYTTQERLEDYKARDAGVDVKPVRIEKPEAADNMPVREWDMGKRGKSRSPQRVRKSSRSLSRERKRPRRSQSPGSSRRRHSRSPHHDRRSRGEAKEAEPLGKALDELFRKTAATPSIYWLPLTPQQIAEKEELRRKRMIERERRLAEMSKMRPR